MSDEEKKTEEVESTFTPAETEGRFMTAGEREIVSALRVLAAATLTPKLLSREVFIQKALLALATNPYFFQTNGLHESLAIERLLKLANSMWAALNPQQVQTQPVFAQAPVPGASSLVPQPQPAVAPPAVAAPVAPPPAYQALPGFMGGAQSVSVGGQPTVQSQPVAMGATVATPYAGGVGSGVPSYQPQSAGGNKVQVIAENFQGQNLGPGQVPSAPMAPVAVPQVTVSPAPAAPQQPGRF